MSFRLVRATAYLAAVTLAATVPTRLFAQATGTVRGRVTEAGAQAGGRSVKPAARSPRAKSE